MERTHLRSPPASQPRHALTPTCGDHGHTRSTESPRQSGNGIGDIGHAPNLGAGLSRGPQAAWS